MSVSPHSRQSPLRRARARITPPLWAQWVLSLLVATVAIVLLVRFVDAQSTPQAQAPHVSPKGARILNQEAEIIDAQEQAPMVVHFASSVSAVVAITHAVAGYMTTQINFNRLSGPLRETLCFPVPGATGDSTAYRCSALARNTSYPFEGVVDRATHVVVYCRHNPPPAPGDKVPVSRRCLV